MSEIRNLTRNGETFYPLTTSSAVINENTGTGMAIDSEPTPDSHNLVESGSIYNGQYFNITIDWEDGGIDTGNGKNNSVTNRVRSKWFIPIKNNTCTSTSNYDIKHIICVYSNSDYNSYLGYIGWSHQGISLYDYITTNYPTAKYFRILIDTNSYDGSYYKHFTVFNKNTYSAELINSIETEGGYYQYYNWKLGKGIITTTGQIVDNPDRAITYYIPLTKYNSVSFKYGSNVIFAVVFFTYENMSGYISSNAWYVNTELKKSYFDISSIAPENANYYIIMINSKITDPTSIKFYNNVTEGYTNKNLYIENLIKFRNYLVVDQNGFGDYETIEDALANAGDSYSNHVTIIVNPGTYYPAPRTPDNIPYEEDHRNITLIGTDRNSCILRGNVGYYYWQEGVDYALLRLNGNVTIKNFTLINTCENYESVATEKGWDLTNQHARSYCIHVDGSRAKGTTVEIENCKMYNDHFACIGWGLRPESTLRIKNCEAESDVDSVRNAKSGFSSSYGTLYGHLSGSSTDAMNQKLEIIDCLIRNKYFGCGIRQGDASGSTDYAEVSSTLTLVRNVLKTANQNSAFFKFEVPDAPWACALDDINWGNNIPSMNSLS